MEISGFPISEDWEQLLLLGRKLKKIGNLAELQSTTIRSLKKMAHRICSVDVSKKEECSNILSSIIKIREELAAAIKRRREKLDGASSFTEFIEKANIVSSVMYK